MLVNTAQGDHQFGRLSHEMRQGSAAYHRRSHSCLAVASHHEHYENSSYQAAPGSGRYYDIVEVSEEGGATAAIATGAGSSSPIHMRHIPRKSDGTISMTQLQRSLSNAGAVPAGGDNADGIVSVSTSTLGGKLKLNPTLPTSRRSLLSDMLNSQNQKDGPASRLEQNANRRRMLKSMRRYSVDASEMDFGALGLYPSAQVSTLKGIPSEGEETGNKDFSSKPNVRYLRNPSHATVKTKLIQGGARCGDDSDSPDYFGSEDRVW
ncbi:hypothetical protein BG015_008846 [Linnemannia schmuckeri]|uniref:Uncharacterized protein n=1 Tax=Linnemannia schmuckeri TaxID=64567 RepID=A0A9P5VEZ2_9FUNG|nr:hypothetical protein BG015_008846 [Linnemannia schmuckeri]